MNFLDGKLNQTITIEPYTSMDQNGDRTYGSAVTYPCREEAVIRVIKDQNGEDAINTSRIFLAPTVTVTYDDRITIGNSSKPVILRIDKQVDLFGVAAYVEVDT